MRSLTLILIFSFLAGSLIGQSDSTFREVGLNATPFVNQYLDLGSGDGESSSPYMITLEQRFKKKGARAGFGVATSNSTVHPDDDFTEPEFSSHSLALDVRCGWVLYKELSKRWSLKYGVDAIFSYDGSNNTTTSPPDLFGNRATVKLKSITAQPGISPFLFAQFHITPHFSIGTELLARAAYFEIKHSEENSQFPEFSDSEKTTGTTFSIQAPTALFFIFRL